MGNELWHPDINITVDSATTIIAKQFPDLAPSKIKCIGEGWDNKVFLVNDQLIFRFPHREIAATLIERENAVLAHLQARVTLKIPNPIYVGKPDDNYPYHFHGYQVIDGKSGCHANLSASARNRSITELADFLKRLHSITEMEAQTIGAKDQVFDRTDADRAINALAERVEKINARNIALIDLKVFDNEMKIAAAVNLPTKKVLVHGDLYCRHLMFEQEELVGIIDWGDVGINNPAVDLGVVFSFYPAHCHQVFFDIYGALDSETHAYARFLGLYSAITVMLYGHDIEDPQLVQEAKESLLRINSKLLEQSS